MSSGTDTIREAFANPNPVGLVATVAFVLLFVVVVVYLVTDRRHHLAEKMQNLPLEDDRHG